MRARIRNRTSTSTVLRKRTKMSETPPKNGTTALNIVPWVAVVLSLGSAFWAVANPRDDIKTLKAEMREDLRHSEELAEKQIEMLKHALADRETLAQHIEFANRMLDQANTFKEDIRSIRSDLVPRTEHQQHWNEVNDRISTVRDSINDVRKDLVSIAPPADRFKSMEAQITALQNRFDMLSRNQGPFQIQGLPKSP